jgi:hypothetical protein
MKRRNRLILEFTEFNLQRYNSDSAISPVSTMDDPSLSINAFDKHQDALRQAMSRINDIMYKLSGTNAYKNLRSKLALEQQDIQSMKIIRIMKVDNINYNVYISFVIDEEEYWGVIENVLSPNIDFKSEVFRDYDLYQAKEWIIKIKGLIIKTIKEWLKPEPGMYKLINNNLLCYSIETGKQLSMENGIEIELVRSYDDRLVISYENDTYELIGDNFIYFNWWFIKN